MRPAPFKSFFDREQGSLRRRAAAVALTIIAHALLLLLLLRLAPEQFGVPRSPGLTTFSLLPSTDEATKKADRTDQVHRRSGGAPPRPAPPLPETKPPPPPPLPVPPIDILPLSRQEMAAADISHLHSDRAPGQGETTGESTGADSGSTTGSVPGVGTVQLYKPEWYREPTDAELNFYLPKNRSVVGKALVACQTIARFHVDNCRELGDTPPGTGLGYAVTQAAWQFLIRPPRVDGKPLIGAWVVIEYTVRAREAK